MSITNYSNISNLMSNGTPVCISFETIKEGEHSNLLFCEMVQKARYGEKFLISSQKCRIAKYIFRGGAFPPYNYYLKSNRYSDINAAKQAIDSFPTLLNKKQYKSIRIEPLSKNRSDFDLVILYLTPEKAMRIIQAYSYHTGKRININTLGATSICGECTASVLEKKLVISFGCKGSRKHSKYSNNELPVGISFEIIPKIEEGLKITPETMD